MMKMFLCVLCLLVVGFFTNVVAQEKPAPDYKIIKINLLPFEVKTGKFEDGISDKDERTFFNEISKRYFVTVEVSGESGSFEMGRKLEITVTEGKTQVARKSDQIDLIGEDGKVYMPLWIDKPLCSNVTITARIIGQKTPSTLTRKITLFQCGE